MGSDNAKGRRRHPLPEGIAPPPRHRTFTREELAKLFVSAENGRSFAELDENSNVMCTWQCEHGHRYQESRVSHNRSRGCPICAVSIATRMPGLVQFWDTDKNDKPVTDISAYSREHHHWKCEYGHEFTRPPYRVLATGHQCQECRRQGNTAWNIAGKREAGVTLADAFPEIAAEWDYDKNPRGPREYAPGSQRVAYWICEHGCSWSSPICHRTSAARHPASCQKCKAIAYTAPELAAQLHPTLNPKDTAYTVRRGSSEVLSWQCDCGHVFEASVAARLRAVYPASCPKCRSIAIKAPELIKACWAYERNGDLDPESLKTSSSEEAWWVRMNALGIPPEARKPEHFERKRIGYRYRRYINNPEREVDRIRRILEDADPAGTYQAGTSQGGRAQGGQASDASATKTASPVSPPQSDTASILESSILEGTNLEGAALEGAALEDANEFEQSNRSHSNDKACSGS
ncbi:MAG: zinc-ribbon domain-containing protein [Pseudomonadota bacterium]